MQHTSTTLQHAASRGAIWFAQLTGTGVARCPGYPPSLLVADSDFDGRAVRHIAVIPDPQNRFVRARNGEVGLLEGWYLAQAVHELIERDQRSAVKTAIVAIVDVVSQAYGRREEAYGIHLALAAAADAYATARQAGHPVVALLVGKAMSGAFLAHGYQANRIIALHDPQVMVHAMGKESAARITLRSVEALEALAASVAPMAYDIQSFATLGMLSQLLTVHDPDQPDPADLHCVQQALRDALHSIADETAHDFACRLTAPNRRASQTVRSMLEQQWQ